MEYLLFAGSAVAARWWQRPQQEDNDEADDQQQQYQKRPSTQTPKHYEQPPSEDKTMANHLASFVAAVLRDRTVDDVLNEMAKMKEKESKSALIEITGEGGSPVYATGDIRDGLKYPWKWVVIMTQTQECRLIDIYCLQIRLGGMPLLQRNNVLKGQCQVLHQYADGFNEATGYGRFAFFAPDYRAVGHIGAVCGPFEDHAQYVSVDHAQGQNLRGRHMTTLGNSKKIRFQYVAFRVPDILACLERFGISSEEAWQR